MAIRVYPDTESFACELGDVDLSKPLSPEDEACCFDIYYFTKDHLPFICTNSNKIDSLIPVIKQIQTIQFPVRQHNIMFKACYSKM